MASHEEVLALQRYLLQTMRAYYDHRLDKQWPEQWIELCLWYACLYVVVEG